MQQRSFETDLHGQTLRGTAYLAGRRGEAERRRPAVVMLHGFTGTRIEAGFNFMLLGRQLARAGVHAITFDFRGSGESDGAFEEMLVTGEIDDALRILNWTRSQPCVDRRHVALLGFSLGGLVASCAAARTAGPIAALALIAPTTVDNLSRHAGEAAHDGPVIVGPHTLHPNFFDDLRTLDPLTDITRCPCPTLVVQGTDDEAVKPGVSDQFIEALRAIGAAVQATPIQGANHVFSTPEHRRQMIDAVVGFLSTHLPVS